MIVALVLTSLGMCYVKTGWAAPPGWRGPQMDCDSITRYKTDWTVRQGKQTLDIIAHPTQLIAFECDDRPEPPEKEGHWPKCQYCGEAHDLPVKLLKTMLPGDALQGTALCPTTGRRLFSAPQIKEAE